MKAKLREGNNESPLRCCWVGGTRYSYPLDETSEEKFGALKKLGELFVIGFSTHLRACRFTQHARFFLLPQSRFSALRYCTFLLLSPIVMLWLVNRYGVNVLIAQSPYEGFAAAWAKILARILFRKRVALIVENHGDFEKDLFLQRKIHFPSIHQFLMKTVAAFSLRRADALRAISEATKEQLEKWTTGKPIVKFITWTDIKAFLDAGSSTVHKTESFILYVGVLIPRKGVHFLLESFAQIADTIKDTKLVLLGKPEEDSYAETLRKMTDSLGLHDRVTFMGPMTQSKLARIMARAQVLVLPSLSEGLGRVVLEAMACGTPVIGSAVGGIPDMIQEGENGFLIRPGDVGALAERMQWILEHSQERTQLGERARKFAEEFFSEELYIQNYSDLIERSLS